MRPTWIVLGLVVGIGAVAYVRLREKAGEAKGAPLARTAGAPNGAGEPVAGEPAMAAVRASEGAAEASDASPALAKPAAASEPTGSPEETAAAELRAKLDAPFERALLHTVRGMGYVLEARDE